MTSTWIHLDHAVADALAGRIQNGATVAGLLAAAYARDHDWSTLRPAELEWLPHDVGPDSEA